MEAVIILEADKHLVKMIDVSVWNEAFVPDFRIQQEAVLDVRSTEAPAVISLLKRWTQESTDTGFKPTASLW